MMKKTHANAKVRGVTKASTHQLIFELKQKAVLALNKLADRDTYQIGVDELDATAESLSAEGVAPFLSCILDNDSEQKSVVRKECVRLMGSMARIHRGLMTPHIGKIIGSIVKRLKDPDSIVRDACVETVGIIVGSIPSEGSGVFLVLVKPLFEALGEQNKQAQSGSALCLVRIIDKTRYPPVAILQRMLIRTTKLLKNPHFMAKPAILELNRSIIQAGGATTQNLLSAAIASIQEALKDSDWATRKAASVTLGELASSGGSSLGFSRVSCIRSLESCRFDKVKPVRDAVLQALKFWKSLPGVETSDLSESGSSMKENISSEHNDISSITTEYVKKNFTVKKVGAGSIKSRVPLSTRETSQNHTHSTHHLKPDDWHVEISVPNVHHAVSLAEFQDEESESSCVTKTLGRMSFDVTSMHHKGDEYMSMDDKQEISSVSNLVTDNFETKFSMSPYDCITKRRMMPIGNNLQFGDQVINNDEQLSSTKIYDHVCPGSTFGESNLQTLQECCIQMANEMVCIRKQLQAIEAKQANLNDQLQVSTARVMDTLSMINSRVFGLEHIVDRLTQDLLPGGRHFELIRSQYARQNQSGPSPRHSNCTPRPSSDVRNRQLQFLSVRNSDTWEDNKVFGTSQVSNSARQDAEMLSNSKAKIGRNRPGIFGSSMKEADSSGSREMRKSGNAEFMPATCVGARKRTLGSMRSVKSFLHERDLNSAYEEALCSGIEIGLMNLLDRTGPVLESLLPKTASDLLATLASYLVEGRFLNSIIPWLQQVVDLGAVRGPNFVSLPAKTKQEILSAIQEVTDMKFSSSAERGSAAEVAISLHHLWGERPFET